MIGNAFGVLRDAEKRRQYDLYGEEETRSPRRNHHGRRHDFTHGFEADMTPEEIFNMFFGGSAFTCMYESQAVRFVVLAIV